jgi:hypothetical protein
MQIVCRFASRDVCHAAGPIVGPFYVLAHEAALSENRHRRKGDSPNAPNDSLISELRLGISLANTLLDGPML